MNLQKRNRLTDSEDELIVARGEGEGERIVRELGMDRYTLLYLKWIANKIYCIVHGTQFNIIW